MQISEAIHHINVQKSVSDIRIYQAGLNLFQQKKVSLIEQGDHIARFIVQEERKISRVELEVDPPQFLYNCTCLKNTEGICKHVVAAHLHFKNISGKKANTPEWKSSLARVGNILRQTTERKFRKSTKRHYLVFFILEESWSESISLELKKIWADQLPEELYANGRLCVEPTELYKKLNKISGFSNQLEELSTHNTPFENCLNASKEVLQLYKVANSNSNNHRYYYYGNTTDPLDYLAGFAAMNAPLFRAKKGRLIHYPLTYVGSVEGGLVVDRTVDGWRLSMSVQGDEEMITVRHQDNPEFLELNRETWLLTNKIIGLVNNDIFEQVSSHVWESARFVVPVEETDFFVEQYLIPVSEHLSLDGTGIVWQETADIEPTKQLYLEEEKDELRARLQFGYGDAIVPFSPTYPQNTIAHVMPNQPKDGDDETKPSVEEIRHIHLERLERKSDWEEEVYRSVSSGRSGLKRETNADPGIFCLRARVDPVDFLLKKVPNLVADGFEIYGEDNLKKARVNRNNPKISLNVSSGIDWFDMQAVIQFGDVPVSLPEFRKAVRNKQQYVKLSDGTMGQIPEEWLKKYQHLFKFGEDGEADDTLRFDTHHIALLDQLLAEADNGTADATFSKNLNQLKNFKSITEHPISPQFQGELRGYQQAGYDWLHFLREFGFGGCLADDMGLGKTVQVLAFLSSLYTADPKLPPTLVIMPRSILHNWERETETFAPHLNTLIHFGNDRTENIKDFAQYQLIFTTYGVALRDVHDLRKYAFHYVILDESQMIKNPNTKTSKAVRLLQSKHRLALTGTPVENSTFELWSQFAFLNPGLLGNVDYFKSEFARPIETGQNSETADLLRKIVYPFILRRTKAQVAPDLPPRTDRIMHIDMEPAQKKFYIKTRDEYRAKLLGTIQESGMQGARMKILEGLLRLRQIANHGKLVNKSFRGDSGKMILLIETLENLAADGHKALVFSQFVQMLKLIEAELKKRKIKYTYLDGSTRKRQEAIDDFQSDPSTPFFLISLKAGGVGLNLTAADYVIHVDPWWNPAVEMQATDRSHRIGQDKPVFVYKMITRGTVEEKILQLQEKKRNLVEKLITTEGSFFKDLSTDDVQVLFS